MHDHPTRVADDGRAVATVFRECHPRLVVAGRTLWLVHTPPAVRSRNCLPLLPINMPRHDAPLVGEPPTAKGLPLPNQQDQERRFQVGYVVCIRSRTCTAKWDGIRTTGALWFGDTSLVYRSTRSRVERARHGETDTSGTTERRSGGNSSHFFFRPISVFLYNAYDGVGVQVDDAVVFRERVREELHELRRAAAAALRNHPPGHLFSRWTFRFVLVNARTREGEPVLVNDGWTSRRCFFHNLFTVTRAGTQSPGNTTQQSSPDECAKISSRMPGLRM